MKLGLYFVMIVYLLCMVGCTHGKQNADISGYMAPSNSDEAETSGMEKPETDRISSEGWLPADNTWDEITESDVGKVNQNSEATEGKDPNWTESSEDNITEETATEETATEETATEETATEETEETTAPTSCPESDSNGETSENPNDDETEIL